MTHAAITNLAIQMGYLPIDALGVCHGFTMRWLEARFLHDDMRLSHRVESIKTDPLLIKKIDSIRARIRRDSKISLTAEESEIFAVPAFLESMLLYHSPANYHRLLDQTANQEDIDLVSNYASSTKISEMGGLATVYSEAGIYTKQELEGYLLDLAKAIDSLDLPQNTRIGFKLSGHDHSIGLTYDSGSGHWCLMDINHWPPQTAPAEIVATNLFNYFHARDQKNNKLFDPYVAFNTKCIVPASNSYSHQLNVKLEELKQSHLITKEISQRETTISLLWLATEHGHTDLVTQLLELGSSPNAPNLHGDSPLWRAAFKGDVDIVTKLLEFGALPDICEQSETTPLWIASQNGHHHVVAKLLEFGALPNIGAKDKTTPLWIAAQNGHLNIVTKLLEYDVDFEIANDKGMTPYDLAVARGHKDIARLIGYYSILRSCYRMIEPILNVFKTGSRIISHFFKALMDCIPKSNKSSFSFFKPEAVNNKPTTKAHLPSDQSKPISHPDV